MRERRKPSSFGRILLLMLGFLCMMLGGVWLFSSCVGAVRSEPPASAALNLNDDDAADAVEPSAVPEVSEADVLPDESDFDGANNEVGSFAG